MPAIPFFFFFRRLAQGRAKGGLLPGCFFVNSRVFLQGLKEGPLLEELARSELPPVAEDEARNKTECLLLPLMFLSVCGPGFVCVSVVPVGFLLCFCLFPCLCPRPVSLCFLPRFFSPCLLLRLVSSYFSSCSFLFIHPFFCPPTLLARSLIFTH